MAGLPYTAINSANVYVAGTYYATNAASPNGDNIKPIVFLNTSSVYMMYQSATTVSYLTGTNLGTSFNILVSVIYETAS